MGSHSNSTRPESIREHQRTTVFERELGVDKAGVQIKAPGIPWVSSEQGVV
jgi:hypothetical protein